jgi:hypothetical protein
MVAKIRMLESDDVKIRISIIYMALIHLSLACQSAAFADDVGDEAACDFPDVNFNYSYLDSLTNTFSPGDTEFMRHSSDRMSSGKAQIFLWYVYRNKRVAPEFFKKVKISSLLARKDDSINSILWLMMKRGGYFAASNRKYEELDESSLSSWWNEYKASRPREELRLELYSGKSALPQQAMSNDVYGTEDVDLTLRQGMFEESSDRRVDALFHYVKVAGYGYQIGLTGAALLLPQLGGDKCVSRSAYYVLLSGSIAPVNWVGHGVKNRNYAPENGK